MNSALYWKVRYFARIPYLYLTLPRAMSSEADKAAGAQPGGKKQCDKKLNNLKTSNNLSFQTA